MITNLYFKSKKSFVPFVPTDIAGCKLWLKADAGITKDGSNYVSQWADQSGNNNHAVQATGSAQPLWVDNQLNGKPALYFDGTLKYLIASELDLSQPIHIAIILKKTLTDYAHNRYIVDGVSVNHMALYDCGDSVAMYAGASGPSKAISDDVFILIESVFNGANSNISVNGGVKATGNAGNIGSTGGIIIGAAYGYNYTNSLNGQISEIVMYDNVITDANRMFLGNYFNTKYNLWQP